MVSPAPHLKPLLSENCPSTAWATISLLFGEDQAGVQSLLCLRHLDLGDVVQPGVATFAEQLSFGLASSCLVQQLLALLAREASKMVNRPRSHPSLRLVNSPSTPWATFLPFQGNYARSLNMSASPNSRVFSGLTSLHPAAFAERLAMIMMMMVVMIVHLCREVCLSDSGRCWHRGWLRNLGTCSRSHGRDQRWRQSSLG